MTKCILFFLPFLILSHLQKATAQSCLPDGTTFSTQAQIDGFQSDYPGCTRIEGDVVISGEGITSLMGLSALSSVGGRLRIWNNPHLNELTGLSGLSSVDGNLEIWDNNALISLSGLEGLASTGGSLTTST